jgi:hypothetical protein
MNDLWLMPEGEEKWKLLEELFSLPPDKRLEWMIKNAQEKKIGLLGHTDKTGPEIATELIKRGVKAKSYITGKKKPLTKGL